MTKSIKDMKDHFSFMKKIREQIKNRCGKEYKMKRMSGKPFIDAISKLKKPKTKST